MTSLPSSTGQSLAAALTQLPSLPRQRLVALWEERMGKPPPKAASCSLLVRAIAYAIQEQQLGGLRGSELRILRNIAGRVGEPVKTRKSTKNARKVDGPVLGEASGTLRGSLVRSALPRTSRSAIPIVLKPGTRLVREWQGKSHAVDVQADGFSWNGEVYRSLSAVAAAITGARWSGHRFFRL